MGSRREKTNQMTLFPDPATKIGVCQKARAQNWWKERTFSVDPQEGASRLPFDEYSALKEPDGRSLVLSLSGNDVVCGRIGRREPRS
jgi:hypothetical protein